MGREDAFARVKQALTVIGAVITAEHEPAGQIEAKVPFSFKSWGELVKVQVTGSDDQVLVNIVSQTAWWATLGDWGKNQQNVDLIRQFLSASESGSA
jgi:hypothetical protein